MKIAATDSAKISPRRGSSCGRTEPRHTNSSRNQLSAGRMIMTERFDKRECVTSDYLGNAGRRAGT
jgi:hypothetical protein